MPLAVELRGVAFAYGRGHRVLAGVDLVIDEGEFVAIAGPNGGGKTTLLRLVLGLEQPSAGTVLLFGEPAHRSSLRPSVGYLPQRPSLGTDAPATVREVVAAGRVAAGRLLGPLPRRDRLRVEEAIARVGLVDQADAPLRTLSGGQQQLAFLAKALAGEPALLVLDEPTAGVDVDAQEALAELLRRLHVESLTTVLYVSHEFGTVEHVAKRLVLVRGGIVFDGRPSELPRAWHDPSHAHA